MFDVQIRFMEGGHPVAFDGLVAGVFAEIARRVWAEIQNLPQVRPMVAELPGRQREEDERKGPKPLAVGINEAAKMLRVSARTVWNLFPSGESGQCGAGGGCFCRWGFLRK
jgi:hypothetical protein